MRTLPPALTILAYAISVAACRGSSGTTPSIDDEPYRITLTPTGASPTSLTVPRGAQVTVRNDDARAHQISSDPHPTHTDCPELNQIGVLAPGDTRQSGNLITPGVCGFHDHLEPGNRAWQGAITIE